MFLASTVLINMSIVTITSFINRKPLSRAFYANHARSCVIFILLLNVVFLILDILVGKTSSLVQTEPLIICVTEKYLQGAS